MLMLRRTLPLLLLAGCSTSGPLLSSDPAPTSSFASVPEAQADSFNREAVPSPSLPANAPEPGQAVDLRKKSGRASSPRESAVGSGYQIGAPASEPEPEPQAPAAEAQPSPTEPTAAAPASPVPANNTANSGQPTAGSVEETWHKSSPSTSKQPSAAEAAVLLAFQLGEAKFPDSAFGSWIRGVAHLTVLDCAKAATRASSPEQAVASLGLDPDTQARVLGASLSQTQKVPYATPGNLPEVCAGLAKAGFAPECVPDVLEIAGKGHSQLQLHKGDQLQIARVHLRCGLGRGERSKYGTPFLGAQHYHMAPEDITSAQLNGVEGRAQLASGTISLYTSPGAPESLEDQGTLTIATPLPVKGGAVEFSVTARPRR